MKIIEVRKENDEYVADMRGKRGKIYPGVYFGKTPEEAAVRVIANKIHLYCARKEHKEYTPIPPEVQETLEKLVAKWRAEADAQNKKS